jgi:hypothetical protein
MGCNKDRACGTDRLFCPIFLFDKGPGRGSILLGANRF